MWSQMKPSGTSRSWEHDIGNCCQWSDKYWWVLWQLVFPSLVNKTLFTSRHNRKLLELQNPRVREFSHVGCGFGTGLPGAKWRHSWTSSDGFHLAAGPLPPLRPHWCFITQALSCAASSAACGNNLCTCVPWQIPCVPLQIPCVPLQISWLPRTSAYLCSLPGTHCGSVAGAD
jgi:hypothetical protein